VRPISSLRPSRRNATATRSWRPGRTLRWPPGTRTTSATP